MTGHFQAFLLSHQNACCRSLLNVSHKLKVWGPWTQFHTPFYGCEISTIEPTRYCSQNEFLLWLGQDVLHNHSNKMITSNQKQEYFHCLMLCEMLPKLFKIRVNIDHPFVAGLCYWPSCVTGHYWWPHSWPWSSVRNGLSCHGLGLVVTHDL